MSKTKENIIVTGGYGFIGSHLIKTLNQIEKYNIINIDNLSYASSSQSLELIDKKNYTHLDIDISKYKKFNSLLNKYQPKRVFHLAAESHVDRSIDSPDNFIATNVYGTYNILEGIKFYLSSLSEAVQKEFKYLHVSTDEVYGSKNTGKSKENDNLMPNSPYSSSKAASDLLVRAWNKTYGIPTLITRCTNNYGPWQYPEKLIPVVISSIINYSKIPIYGNGQQIRDWIHVQDHVDALITLSENNKNLSGEVYNIGADNELTNIELVKLICRICDNKIPNDKGSYLKLIDFVDDRPGHDNRYALNNSKIIENSDWKPKIEFIKGLENTVEWYVENHSSLSKYFTSKYDGKRIGLGR
mgnify:FL=1|tara:strand:- start:3249 stop:4316 length:1068 start_codon:yes stop_codon:yes gene_type:complete